MLDRQDFDAKVFIPDYDYEEISRSITEPEFVLLPTDEGLFQEKKNGKSKIIILK